MQVEKTVFISYRRTNAMTARAVYQYLTAHGYDCFLDFESIDAGSFERIILNQIAAKAHFVVILTPSALERCAEPGDWLRREIEYALDNQRNVVPLMFEGFRYSDVQKYLTGKLNILPQYNSLEIPTAYFEEAMTRLENRFLNKPLDVILRLTPIADRQAVAEAKAKVEQQPTVTEEGLSAEEWNERSFKRGENDFNGMIADLTEAIGLNPRFAEAYNNRGVAYYKKGDLDSAIRDCTEAIHLNPEFAEAFNNRGFVRYYKDDLDGAIADYTEAIRLKSQYAEPYSNRALARYKKGDLDSAIRDCTEAIHLDPQCAGAYSNRATIYFKQGEYDKAISDYKTALRINPNDSVVKKNFELVKKNKPKKWFWQ